jgi:hypothetical protein
VSVLRDVDALLGEQSVVTIASHAIFSCIVHPNSKQLHNSSTHFLMAFGMTASTVELTLQSEPTVGANDAPGPQLLKSVSRSLVVTVIRQATENPGEGKGLLQAPSPTGEATFDV